MVIASYFKQMSWWIPVSIALITFGIAMYLSVQQGFILNKVKSLSEDTNNKLNEAVGTLVFGDGPSNGNTIKVEITPGWSFATKLTLYKVGNKNSYVFDIGDSFVKNRMSLFLDEYGFLNWRIIDSEYKIHSIRKDFNSFIGIEKTIVLVKGENNNFKLYTGAEEYIEMDLSDSDFSISSNDFYLGSDLNGENRFYLESRPRVRMNE